MPTISIDLTAAQANRAAAALGTSLGLKDNQTPPQPRAATMAEARTYLIKVLVDMTKSVEEQAAKKAALDAVSVAEMSIT